MFGKEVALGFLNIQAAEAQAPAMMVHKPMAAELPESGNINRTNISKQLTSTLMPYA
jgi:hypothetical protein